MGPRRRLGARAMVDIEHGERTAQRATILVALLATLKGIVGFVTNSAAMLADALHSTVDVMTAAATWIGLKIARRPADQKFPYGYYRAESLVALLVAGIVLWGSVELFLDGVHRIQHPELVEMPWLAAGMALIASVTSYYISKMEKEAAEVSNSQALKAVSVESLADTLSSLVVFLAIVAGSYLHVPWAEGVGALLVAAWVFKIGAEMLWNAVLSLMDVAPEDVEKEVEEILRHVDEITGYKNLRLRRSGPVVFGEVIVFIPADVPVAKADEIARRVQEYILTVPEIEDFRVYVEREEPRKKKVIIPVTEDGKVAGTFATAPKFAVFVADSGIRKEKEIENIARKRKVRRGLAAAKLVLEEKPYAVIVKNIGEISYHTLKDALVTIHRTTAEEPEEAVKEFLEGKTEELHAPTVKKE